jgi:hypothetical protein
MREEDSAQAAALQHAATEERLHQLAVVIAALFGRLFVSLFLRPCCLLAQESCDEGATSPAVTNHAAADREFREIFSFPCTGTHVVLL